MMHRVNHITSIKWKGLHARSCGSGEKDSLGAGLHWLRKRHSRGQVGFSQRSDWDTQTGNVSSPSKMMPRRKRGAVANPVMRQVSAAMPPRKRPTSSGWFCVNRQRAIASPIKLSAIQNITTDRIQQSEVGAVVAGFSSGAIAATLDDNWA